MLRKNEFIPFNGILYNKDKISNIGDVLTLPYDVISPEMQDNYYKKSPWNIIRIILGKEYPTDNEQNNKYTRAAKYFKKWLSEGILNKFNKKCFYIYQQEYYYENNKKILNGIIGLVKLQDYKKKLILPHEDTLNKPIIDRFKLTITTSSLFEAIYGIYKDSELKIDRIILDYISKHKPIFYYNEDGKIEHSLWAISDEDKCKEITKVMKNKKIYIADGHHRYQMMLNLQKIHRKEQGFFNQKKSFNYIMMFLANTESAGITILPVHRLLHNLDNINLKNIIKKIKYYFHVKEFQYNNSLEEKIQKQKWLYELKELHKNTHTFGAMLQGIPRYFLLTLKDSESYEKMVKIKKSSAWKRLDVTVLHSLFIDNILHLSKRNIADQINITYIKELELAIKSIKDGKYQLGLFLNPTKLSQVLKIADGGEKMPQKSTYFYPKLLTGLVIYQM